MFSDWFAAGPEADDFWQKYETARGRSYREALNSPAAQHVFHFDKTFLDRADAVVLVTPAGKSGHLELGYSIGRGVPGYVLMESEPERWDVMLQFARGIAYSVEELTQMILTDHVFDDERSNVVVG